MTGSGVVVSALSRVGAVAGDSHHLICAGYPADDWSSTVGGGHEVITCTDIDPGEVPFPVPGMSDVMPYPSVRYRDLDPADVDTFVAAFRQRLVRAAEVLRPDVVHIHHLWVLTDLAASIDLPCVVTVHGTDLQQARTARQHRPRVVDNLARLRHVFCVSAEIADDAQHEYGLSRNLVSVVGNGYDGSVFNPHGPRRETGRRLVVCAGKLVWWKGFQYAIRASARARVPHDLVIIGGGPDTERSSLEESARRVGATVTFTGHLDHREVATWLRSADVFMLPSVQEPFGLVLLEAMACGCRVVSAGVAGPRDLVSPDLVRDGLVRLVRPVAIDAPGDEDRYVDELAAALDDQLGRVTSMDTRLAVSATVAHRSWEATYAKVRGTYLSLL